MKLSISVMAHPSRKEYVDHILQQLGNVPVAWDSKSDIWDTCSRAWALYDPNCDYHVVLQDDAIPCKDFEQRAIKFLAKHNSPERAFSFYFGRRKAFKQFAANALARGYAVKQHPSWGVAICLPTYLVKSMLKFCNGLPEVKQDDERISRFLASRHIKTWYPMPSLVDHRAALKSLVGNIGTKREADYFIDRP